MGFRKYITDFTQKTLQKNNTKSGWILQWSYKNWTKQSAQFETKGKGKHLSSWESKGPDSPKATFTPKKIAGLIKGLLIIGFP